tara:strand:+ start:62 stop:592 length:531 start_codon:yes stop_codon:yes gene_type:complete
MIRNQLNLFPELDPYKTLIKDIDYIDLSTLKDLHPNHARLHDYSLLPKGRYILHKTGGINPFREKMGAVFPFIKDLETGKNLSLNISKFYVRGGSIHAINNGKHITVDIKMHRVTALAFVENDCPEKKLVVDHINKDRLDYRVTNLRWATSSQNNTGISRPRNECWEASRIKEGKL